MEQRVHSIMSSKQELKYVEANRLTEALKSFIFMTVSRKWDSCRMLVTFDLVTDLGPKEYSQTNVRHSTSYERKLDIF